MNAIQDVTPASGFQSVSGLPFPVKVEAADYAAKGDPDPVEMRDAANWNAPGLNGWTGPVCGYPNREPPWPPDAFDKFGRVMRISVHPPAEAAKTCRAIDVERFAAAPRHIAGFVHAREAAGHKDATAYFSISLWPRVHKHLVAASIGPDRIRLWVAWWRNDRQPVRITFPGGWIAWAHQFENVEAQGIDRSMVWGAQNFDHSPGHSVG